MDESLNDAASPVSFLSRLLPKLFISLVLAALFSWLVMRGGVPLLPDAEAFSIVRWEYALAYVAILAASHFARATRWRFLIAPVQEVSVRESVLLNWIGFFAIFLLPLRLGEFARPALTRMRLGVSVSVGLGTVAVERVIDGLITSGCLVVALFALQRQPSDDPFVKALPFYGYASLFVFVGAFCALALFLWKRAWAETIINSTLGRFAPRVATILAQKIGDIADGLLALARGKELGGFLFESLVYWGLNAFGMWVLALGCDLPMNFGQALGIMGILAIGILLPAGPGLFGNFQFAVLKGLELYFVGAAVDRSAGVYIFLLYTIQFVFLTLTGVLPLLIARIPFSALLDVRPTIRPSEPEAVAKP